jgi:hypothetical protein
MMMSNTEATKLLKKAHQLKESMIHINEDKSNRLGQEITEILFDSDSYTTLYDESILAEVLQALQLYYADDLDDFSESFASVQAHFQNVHEVHDKLYRITDASLSVGTLLYEHLVEWTFLEDEMQFAFDKAIEDQLQNIRAQGPTMNMLLSFTECFFTQLTNQGLADAIALLEPFVGACIQSLARYDNITLRGLFLLSGRGEVADIAIKAIPTALGEASVSQVLHNHDADMKNAARGRARTQLCE